MRDMNSMRWLVGRQHGLLALLFCLAALAPIPGLAQSEARVPAEFWDALRRDDTGRVQTLLLRGVDTNATHPEHGPAIVVAAREHAWATVKLLAAIPGTQLDAPNRRGETALMLAALAGNLDSVSMLVGRDAEVNRPGWTPLHYAASSGHLEVIRYLLERHAYIDAQSPTRTTPLMMAARHEHADAVRLLIEAGADPSARNEAGLDAADYAQRRGDTELAVMLRERAADYVRRYGTLERPRSVDSVREERRPQGALPGTRD